MPKKIRERALKSRKEVEKDLKQKVMLYDKLPDHCLTCEQEFDKNSLEQVMKWRVVVKKDSETVRLYCPDCFEKASEIIKDFEKRIKERQQEAANAQVQTGE